MTIEHANSGKSARKLASEPSWRYQRSWGYSDLAILSILAGLIPLLVFVPIAPVRILIGLLLVLFAPGYALVALLFPRGADLDGLARAALSIGLSVAMLPVLAFILDVSPWGLRPWPVALSLTAWIVGVNSLAVVRRALLPPATDDEPIGGSPTERWITTYRGLLLGAGAVALVATLAIGVLFFTGGEPTKTTELYTLGTNGSAQGYPREATVGVPVPVRLGIRNQDGTLARYRIEVRSGGTLLSQVDPIVLQNGATWEETVSYTLLHAGTDQQVDILLFANDTPEPYRRLRLWINVDEKSNQ